MKIELKINPRLFLQLGKQQYKNHSAVIAVRELLQNSRDACRRVNRTPDIRISVLGNEPTIVNCLDNGCGMSELDIANKLLQLGGDNSENKGKDDVGGFGVAKAILFSCAPWYVKSHETFFDSDILFNNGESQPIEYLDGTEVQVSVEKRVNKGELVLALGMVAFSDVSVQFTYNNQTETLGFTGDLKLHKETGQCRVYLTDPITVFGEKISGYAIYRLKGLVQFIENKQFKDFNVIIDIKADDLDAQSPDYPLTSSREGLRGNVWYQIYSLLSDFRENPNTARANLDDSANEVKLYENKIFTRKRKKRKKPANSDNDSPDNVPEVEEDELDNDSPDNDCQDAGQDDASQEDNQDNSEQVRRHSSPGVGLPVIVKGRKDKPSTEERRLLRIWGEVIRLVAHDEVFGVGIIESEHANAARLEYGQFPYYLLNTSNLPELSKDGLILYFWVLAQHECSHLWQANHNEDFTSLIAQLAKESADLVSPAMVKIKRTTARRI